MHLLFVIDHLNSGGAQRQLVNLAIGLHRKNHTIEFFVYYPQDFFSRQLDALGIKIHHHFKRSRYSPDVLFSLFSLIKKTKYDLVLSFLITPNFYTEVVKLISSNESPGLIVSERSCDSSAGVPFHIGAMRQFHRLADQVTVNSHHQRIALEKRYAWIRNKICTIYNGIDLNHFYPDPHVKKSDEPLKLLAVASISHLKNGFRLIKALEILQQKYQLFPTVCWVGEHQMQIPDRRDASLKWKEEIRRLHLENQWEWFDQRNDIAQLMRSHDALIHPSYLEGLPNSVCEALASGLPVLVSDAMDHPLLVQNGLSGFLFDPYSPESMAEAIYRFSKMSVAERRAMKESARCYAEKELSLESYIEKYEQLLFRLMK